MKDFVLYLGIACLFTHELDAMPNHEWRIMPVLRTLPDDVGLLVFVVGHVPLFAIVLALVASLKPRTRRVSRIAISALVLAHGLGHWLLQGTPAYEFSSPLSHVLIFGAAACGLAFLLLEWRDPSIPRR